MAEHWSNSPTAIYGYIALLSQRNVILKPLSFQPFNQFNRLSRLIDRAERRSSTAALIRYIAHQLIG